MAAQPRERRTFRPRRDVLVEYSDRKLKKRYPAGTRRQTDVDNWLKFGHDVVHRKVNVDST